MRHSALERYSGHAPSPFAVYRPFGIGALRSVDAVSLGICHLSGGAVLEQERNDLLAEEATVIKAIDTAGGKRTDEQAARLLAIDARIEGANGIPSLKAEIAADQRRRERLRAEPSLEDDLASGLAAAVGLAFDQATPPKPFRSLGEQLVAVARAGKNQGVHPGLTALNDWHSKVAAAAGANELVGSEGGYLVQTDLSNGLLGLAHETSILYDRTDRRPIGPNANGTKFNIIDETSRADGSRWGGVQAYWTAEAAAFTGSKPKYAKTQLDLDKLTALYYATDEELGDVTNLEANVSVAFGEEFGFKLDDAIVRGSGAGMPLGWLNAGATVSVAKETGQAAATIVAENVEKMYARMQARSLRNAFWYVNQDCWPQLFQLHHVIGTGGVPLYRPADGLAGAPFGTLLGRPVEPIEQASTVGTVGDISLVDLKGGYLSIEKGGLKAASSIHVQFLTDETAFRWILRTNGRPKRESPVTPFKGTATQSAFITLATRA